jgi:pimeloyl-ACP methyl ester carboxylesterase
VASGTLSIGIGDDPPPTRYTSLGEADIAYQVLGEGPLDLIYANGLTEHIDLQWDHPLMARYLERLASFSRLIMFDRRGAGASDLTRSWRDGISLA